MRGRGKRRRLIWLLYITYLLVVLLSTAAVGINATASIRADSLRRTERELRDKSLMAAPQIAAALQSGDNSRLDEVVRQIGRSADARITVISADGKVLADNRQPAELMENHADRPEVIAALRGTGDAGDAGGTGDTARRVSETFQTEMMYVAVPLEIEGGAAAVLRLSMPLTEVNQAAAIAYRRIVAGALLVAGVAAIAGLLLSLAISRPISSIASEARRYASGDLARRVRGGWYAEADSLAESLNSMARQLDARIHALQRRQEEQQAVLSGMSEGVVAVDLRRHVLLLNHAAEAMLGAGAERARGRTLAESGVREDDFEKFVEQAIDSGNDQAEAELVLSNQRLVRVHAGPLLDDEQRRVGLVIVLRDVTQLRRLENLRRDFVANVSHELKTPVTSIRGFVETLREGAADDPEHGRRFLDIIARQAERLESIIDDLLSLSRIEQDAEKSRIEMVRTDVGEVVKSAVAACWSAADERQIVLQAEVAADLYLRGNAQLLEQAIINLLQNAIRYSEPGKTVTVHASADEAASPPASIAAGGAGGGVTVSVIDNGCGIAAEHLPRIFERFYCVDKARSRKVGGTGLGLAIVKHIAQAHGGSIQVSSEPGRGSVFTLRLPAPAN